MPKKSSITFEMVSTAADAIKAKGQVPGCRNVRQELGDRGSNDTIIEYLRRWEATQEQKPQGQNDAISPAIARAISEHVASTTMKIKTETDARVAALEESEIKLIEPCKQYRQEIDELDSQLIARESAYAELTGRFQAKEAETSGLLKELASERRSCELVRTEFAKADLHLAALPELKARLDEAELALKAERELSARLHETAAVAEAKLEARTNQYVELTTKLSEMTNARDEALGRFAEMTSNLQQEHKKAAVVQRRLEQATEKLTIALESEKKAREEASELRGQNTELRSQLAVLTLVKSPQTVPS